MINTIKARIIEIFNTYSPEEAGEYLLKMDSNGKFTPVTGVTGSLVLRVQETSPLFFLKSD